MADINLEKRLAGAQRVIDLGCGTSLTPMGQQVANLEIEKLTSVDVWFNRDLVTSRARNHTVVQENIIEHVVRMGVDIYDAALLLDVLEHLDKQDGEMILTLLLGKVRRIVIWIPFGNCPQGEVGGNPYMRHLSEWQPSDLEEFGFDVEVFKDFHTQFSPPVDAGWGVYVRRNDEL